MCVRSSDQEGKQTQSYLDHGPKLHLCQTGVKDLGSELGSQLAVLHRKTLYLRKKEHFLRVFISPSHLEHIVPHE